MYQVVQLSSQLSVVTNFLCVHYAANCCTNNVPQQWSWGHILETFLKHFPKIFLRRTI